jgi:hypothetical protein
MREAAGAVHTGLVGAISAGDSPWMGYEGHPDYEAEPACIALLKDVSCDQINLQLAPERDGGSRSLQELSPARRPRAPQGWTSRLRLMQVGMPPSRSDPFSPMCSRTAPPSRPVESAFERGWNRSSDPPAFSSGERCPTVPTGLSNRTAQGMLTATGNFGDRVR